MKSKKQYTLVEIIIPCFHNSAEQINLLLKNISELGYPKDCLSVTLIQIQEKIRKINSRAFNLKRIFVQKRIGYGQATNIGVSESESNLILLLNPDVRLGKELLMVLVGHILKNPEYGIVGPKIYSMKNPKEVSNIDLPGVDFNRFLGLIKPVKKADILKINKPCQVDWVSGSCLLFRKVLWKVLGGFDEKFFMYWEDADFCLRAKTKGFKIFFIPRGVCWHQGSASIGSQNPEKIYYIVRNYAFFLNRHSRLSGKIILHLKNILLTVAKAVHYVFRPSKRVESKAIILAISDFYQLRKKKRLLTKLSLVGALITAFLLRVWGINGGLPDIIIHFDEGTMIYTAFSIFTRNGALWNLAQGLLMPYILFFIYSLYFLAGLILGNFTAPQSFLVEFFKDSSSVILLGRLFNVIIAVFSVWIIWKVANIWFGEKVAIISSWFLAVAFIHVKEAHYVKNDVLMGLTTILVFHLSSLLVKRGRAKEYILGGILTGIAFGIKYFPAVAGVILVIAHFIRVNQHKTAFFTKNLFFLVSSFVITVVIQMLPTLLLRRDAISEFLYWRNFVNDPTYSNEPPFVTYLFGHVMQGIGIPIFIVSFIGVLFAIRKIREFQYILLLSFPLFFLSTVGIWTNYSLPRHSILLLPSFILLAGIGVSGIVERIKLKPQSVILIGLSTLVMLPTLIRSLKMDRYFSGTDTRELAKSWVENNITPNEKIVVEGTLKPYLYTGAASVLMDKVAIQREIVIAQKIGQPTTLLTALAKANSDKRSYDVLPTFAIDRKYDLMSGKFEQMTDTSFYQKEDYNIIATLNWALEDKLDGQFKKDFHFNYSEVADFTPTNNFRTSPHDNEIDYDKVDEINIFERDLIVGPKIRIFKEVK